MKYYVGTHMHKDFWLRTQRYRLYATPTLLSGAARVLDLGGTFNLYNFSRTGTEADRRAICEDWLQVGDDLRGAFIGSVSELSSLDATALVSNIEEATSDVGHQLSLMDV